MNLYTVIYDSPVGFLYLVANDQKLLLLKFHLKHNNFLKNTLLKKSNNILEKTQKQLSEYFKGDRKIFDIPLDFMYGTDFQKKVWNQLRKINYGTTSSYKHIAEKINNPKSYRAVGNANNKNLISIIVPCHRIISNSGDLAGYGGGLDKKKYLLKLEQSNPS